MSNKLLKEIVTQFTSGLLGKRKSTFMCFAVCAPLQSYLSLCGVETKLIQGEVINEPNEYWEHFWLELKDGRIIDPTADQFNKSKMPRIYIGKKPKQYKANPL